MDIKDQIVAVLGLVVVVLVAGFFYYSNQGGEVAGADTTSNQDVFINAEKQSKNISDLGQQKIDQSIGAEVKAKEKVEQALKNKKKK